MGNNSCLMMELFREVDLVFAIAFGFYQSGIGGDKKFSDGSAIVWIGSDTAANG